MEEYETIESDVKEIYESDKFTLGRIGERKRWYKNSIPGTGEQTEHDGDSLYLSYQNSDFNLIDGKNIDDVGAYQVYKQTVTDVELENGHKGIMFSYLKQRELDSNTSKLEIKLGVIDEDNSDKENIDVEVHTLGQTGVRTKNYLNPKVSVSEDNISIEDNSKRMGNIPFKLMVWKGDIISESNIRDGKMKIQLQKYGIKSIKEEFSEEKVKRLVNSKYSTNSLDHVSETKQLDEDRIAVNHIHETGHSGYNTVMIVDKDGEIEEIENTKETEEYLHLDDVLREHDIKEKKGGE